MKKYLVWFVVAANVAVVAVALALPVLVVPLAVCATLLAVALAYATRAGATESDGGERTNAVPKAALPLNYELRERIAGGTMGDVFRARHQTLGRDVAFKRIKQGTIDDEDTRRFEREARVLSLLKSPHTVEVYDFGVTPDGELFYAMELLDGIDLQTAVREHGPMPPERVVHLLVQACSSLAEAHEQALVHRDIKPANLMICRYGGDFDFLKILDFGLVKKPAGRESMAAVTNPATVLGTPAYLAPESMGGSTFVDHRADLYALAAVAFWLLTGRLLFETDKPLVMVKMHLTDPPPKASEHSPFEIPGALDSLLLDCLQKKPEQRPSSADVIRRRLEEIPLAARWDRDRAAAWWKERPLAPRVASR
ncbi:MAG TPA: serine/threonine-protein kinase [Polyangiaceae bacterium]